MLKPAPAVNLGLFHAKRELNQDWHGRGQLCSSEDSSLLSGSDRAEYLENEVHEFWLYCTGRRAAGQLRVDSESANLSSLATIEPGRHHMQRSRIRILQDVGMAAANDKARCLWW